MLAPKKFKHRKVHRGKLRGNATKGCSLSFGEVGLQVLEFARINSRQIEAARIAFTRHIKRGGNVWIRVFPDTPVSKKPAEVRMGSGKGPLEYWVAEVRPGTVIYEIEGVDEKLAYSALRLAGFKFPCKTKIISKSKDVWRL